VMMMFFFFLSFYKAPIYPDYKNGTEYSQKNENNMHN